jgi:hypothetical protein
VRLCFIAYWLCARLANEWQAKGEKGEVQRLLRRLQAADIKTAICSMPPKPLALTFL